MISYLGSLVQFSLAKGRAGRCTQIPLCVESTHHVPATLGLPRSRVSVLSPSTPLRVLAALYGAGPALSSVRFRILHRSTDSVAPACCVFPGLSGSGSQRLGRTLPGAARLFPPRPQRMLSVRCLWLAFVQSWPLAATLPVADVDHPESEEVFRQEPGPVCRVCGGVASLGLSLPLSPPPCLLPPVGMGRLFSGVSQSLCFANRRQCVLAG